MYIDNIKVFAKNEIEFESLIQIMKILQPGYKNGIWHRKMHRTHKEKREKINNRRNKTTKSGKNKNSWRKIELLELGNIGSGHHQT